MAHHRTPVDHARAHGHWRASGARLHVDLIGVALGLALAGLLVGGLIATAH
jgi:hypothetical protein